MINIQYNKQDNRYIFLTGDSKELSRLESYLNKIPSYMFLPSFRGIPKPEVFLFKRINPRDKSIFYYCYAGLWRTIIDFCDKNNIKHNDLDEEFKYTGFNLSLEEFKSLVSSWNLNIVPREYQIVAAWKILHYKISMSQLATRAGKTLIAYMVFRYCLGCAGYKNILMVVPNVSLVKQAVADISEYQDFFKAETVWQKGEFCEGSNLCVGTFQSLVKRCQSTKKISKFKTIPNDKYDPSFFNKFDVVLIDECHTSKCETIKNILSQDFIKNVKIRFGFSGSIPQADTIDFFGCTSLLGPIIQDIRSKELMNNGFITPIDITQIRINYGEFENNEKMLDEFIRCGEHLNSIVFKEPSEETIKDICSISSGSSDSSKKTVESKFKTYNDYLNFIKSKSKTQEVRNLPFTLQQLKSSYTKTEYANYLIDLCKASGSNLLVLEQMVAQRSNKKLKIICDIISSQSKNGIVFGHNIEYLKFLQQYIQQQFPNRPVYLIQGSTSVKKRDSIINSLLTDEGAILVASYGCVGTGLTLKNIDYGIFAQSFKSDIINKQAMGRGLCLANDKNKYYLFDIIDCFPSKRLYVQGTQKVKLYKSENFDYKIKCL